MDEGNLDLRHPVSPDGVRLAYAASGDGPPLVFVRGMNSHVERNWSEPRNRRYMLALGSGFTVLYYDSRGNGLADHAEDITLDVLLSDLGTVIDDAGIGPVTLYGQGYGSPIALAFAARHPELVSRLLVYAAFALGEQAAIPDVLVRQMREMPEGALAAMAKLSYPDAERLPATLMAREGLAMRPEAAAAYLEFVQNVDVRGDLPNIRSPTLVMHPERSQVVRYRSAEEVAGAIPGAELVRIPSGAYNPWAQESVAPTLHAISAFTGIDLPAAVPEVRTVLATDIVASTERAHRVGEQRARELLEVHDRIVRAALRSKGGREIKHMGDGILAVFPSPEPALAAALAIQRGLADARSESAEAGDVRVGISHGQLVEDEGDVHGTTVVLACRLADAADAGEVLVSEPARRHGPADHPYGPPRTFELKGFPETVTASALQG